MLKALELVWDGSVQHWLSLFLLDLGECGHLKTLQNQCLGFLGHNEQQYSPGTFEILPKHLLEKMDVAYLSQQLVGEWAGDRLIITGDYSEWSPFPPDGEWKKGNLYDFVEKNFSSSHARKIYDCYCENEASIKSKLQKLCGGKDYKVVNLDKKEYLNPQAYKTGDKTVLDFANHCNSVMTGLLISLVHSTGSGGGDFPSSIASQGMWAGDRIMICTPEQLDDFERYRDVSNPSDVEQALNPCCTRQFIIKNWS